MSGCLSTVAAEQQYRPGSQSVYQFKTLTLQISALEKISIRTFNGRRFVADCPSAPNLAAASVQRVVHRQLDHTHPTLTESLKRASCEL